MTELAATVCLSCPVLVVFTYLADVAPDTVAPKVSVKSFAPIVRLPFVKERVPVADNTADDDKVTPLLLLIVKFLILVLVADPIAFPVF